MKKKLLSTVFALAMGATCAFGFTACGGDDDKDADTASKAINYIKAQYENKAEETPITYTVNGVSPVDGTNHTVNWTVDKGEGCTLNDISDYVKVGTMDEKKQVEISITKAEVEIPYVLTASVTVGKETKSVNFKRKVPASTSKHAGTQADPYTPSNVRDVAASMNSKWDSTAADQSKAQSFFYPNNTTPTRVYMKGYVVNTGNQLFQDKGTYAQFIYLADTYGTEKKQDDADVVMLMSVSYDTADSKIKSAADINEGDCLTVTGFIQNYFKNSKSDAQPEISRFRADGETAYQETKCIEIVKAVRTDEQKITAALAGVSATMTVTKTGNTVLPASSEADVSFDWNVESGTAATVSGTNLNVATLPEADATVVIKVTATCGTATAQTKTVTVTVKSASAVAGSWQKVTNAADLKAGDTIILSFGAYAMGAASANTYFRTAVSFDASNPSEAVSTVTLEAASSGKFYLKVSDGYLTAPATGTYNNLLTKTAPEADGTSEWTITIDAEGNATIMPTASSEGRQLLFNSNSGQERFSCYKAANNTNKNVVIYISPSND